MHGVNSYPIPVPKFLIYLPSSEFPMWFVNSSLVRSTSKRHILREKWTVLIKQVDVLGAGKEKMKKVKSDAQVYFLRDHKNRDTNNQDRKIGVRKTELQSIEGEGVPILGIDFDVSMVKIGSRQLDRDLVLGHDKWDNEIINLTEICESGKLDDVAQENKTIE